jgi:hypothetical protein
MKCWSLSTSVRDPRRIPDLLRALVPLEGRKWDRSAETDLYIYEIAQRFRKGISRTKLSPESLALLDDSEDELTYEQAKRIYDENEYVGDGMRGRVDIALLIDLGLAEKRNNVSITRLGKDLLSQRVEMQEVMLNFDLKFQVPQPEHKKYQAASGYLIRPFVGTLALIERVNNLWEGKGHKAIGLSWEEFCLFSPTLVNYLQIDEFANQIVLLREKRKKLKFSLVEGKKFHPEVYPFLRSVLERKEQASSEIVKKNLFDYGDNSFRYFQQSSFIVVRGGNHVDISPLAQPQVKMLIESEEFKPMDFTSLDEYMTYFQDLNSFVPPWLTEEKKNKIKENLIHILNVNGVTPTSVNKIETSLVPPSALKEDPEITQLRKSIIESKIQQMAEKAAHVDFLEQCVTDYERLGAKDDIDEAELTRIKQPTQLEYVAFKTFLSLNDLSRIKPNYPMDDEGNPRSWATGNLPDLEVFYRDFNLICEVTLMTSRDQWMNESQPVQRHFENFLEKYNDKPAICVFIAPRLHADTIAHFDFAFHRKSLVIIPFNFKSWNEILIHVASARAKGRAINQESLFNYFQSLAPAKDGSETTTQWSTRISDASHILEFIK